MSDHSRAHPPRRTHLLPQAIDSAFAMGVAGARVIEAENSERTVRRLQSLQPRVPVAQGVAVQDPSGCWPGIRWSGRWASVTGENCASVARDVNVQV